MKKVILLLTGLGFLTIKNQAQTVADIDGNVYNTVTIGTQVWLKENLKVTHYRNGNPIPNVTNNTQWGNLNTGAYCNYNNNANYANTYGRIYNWYAVNDSNNLCPAGWHVPTNAEWTTLTTYLGGIYVAGGKMKEAGTSHWNGPNKGATNSSGFTALATGYRYFYDGLFSGLGEFTLFWSSTEGNSGTAWRRLLNYNRADVDNEFPETKAEGFSVRCLRDLANEINDINYNEDIKIYSNPAIDKITIDCAERQNMNLSIYNIVGKLVIQRVLTNNKTDIDISSLSKGIYIIKISGEQWTIQKKLIKE